MQPQSWEKMLIEVKTLTGKEIKIDTEPTDKVERIKERGEERVGTPLPTSGSGSSTVVNR